MDSQEHLRVGQVAQRTGKTVRTIHYYEELGLLTPCQRTEGGYRLFGPDTPRRVEMIVQLKDLGFSLDEIAQIVRAWREAPRNAGASERLRGILERARLQASSKMSALRRLERQIEGTLDRLTRGQIQDPASVFIGAGSPEAR